jgi:signal transduction histidine kinase
VPYNANRVALARTQHVVVALCIVALAVSVLSVSSVVPRQPWLLEQGAALHLLLELMVTTIAVVVVAVSFQSLERGSGQSASVLIYSFTVVACTGLAHTVIYQGSPFSGHLPLALSNFFSVVRRGFETLAFALFVSAAVLPRSRAFWMGAAVATSCFVFWIATSGSWWAHNLVAPPSGPSPLAFQINGVFSIINLGTGFLLWRRGVARRSRSDTLLAGASFVLGLVSLVLLLAPPAEILPLLAAHGVRTLAYGSLYAGVYLFAIHEPHELLRQSEDSLRDSREQLKTIGDNLPKGMIYQIHADPSGLRRFVYVSAGIGWLNGLTPEVVKRDASTLYSLVHEDDRAALTLAEIRSYETMGPFNRVVRYYKGNRDEIGWLQICSAPRRSSDGIVVWDGVAIDVTDREQALADLKQLNQDLEQRVAERTRGLVQANQSLESFSRVIAHDLRAPLRHVQSFAALLKVDHASALDDEGRRLLDKVIEGGATLNRLIDGILAVSRLDAAKLSWAEADLSAMCEDIATALQAAEPLRRVEFRIQPGVRAMADRTLLRNVLQNLLGNAWKFTSRQQDARIEFGEAERDGERVFFVRDNGAGFDPNAAQRLFTLFTRLHPVDEFPGTGLGLASVRAVIVNHGGRVWAEGSVGRGATLYFTLAASNAQQRRPQGSTEPTDGIPAAKVPAQEDAATPATEPA